MASRLASFFERALLPIGLVGLGVLIWGAGADNVIEKTRLVGWWFLVVIAQEFVCHVTNTFGLLVCMPADRARLSFWRTFAARQAGEGVNATMPTATIGGELLKISLLARSVPAERVTAGVTAAYATQALAQMLFTAFALPLALPALDLPFSLRILFAIFVLGGVVATYWFAGVLRQGAAFGRAHGFLRKVGLGREGSRAHETSERIDDAAKAAHGASPNAFAASVLWFLFGWFWGIVEVALILHACGYEVNFASCLAIESLSAFIDAVFFFVPGQLATREGGLAAITFGLGLGAEVGVAIGLVRRGRALAWAAIGFLCLGWFRHTAPVVAKKVESQSPEPAFTDASQGT
jgi:hypothetical protein